jgi:OPA family glycerol-3-phosphate transporter-like MFS transporter 1/2
VLKNAVLNIFCFSGYIAERVHLRYFLATGMLGAGISTAMFGVGYYLNIHNYAYYLFMQVRYSLQN